MWVLICVHKKAKEELYMSRLNLLRPVVKKKFLKNARREKIEYLNIPVNMTLKRMKSDIDNGLGQYADAYDKLQGKVSKVILVKGHSREEGLMAISYMAGILNRKEDGEDIDECNEAVYFNNYESADDVDEEENEDSKKESKEDSKEEEIGKIMQDQTTIDYDNDYEICDADCYERWNPSDYQMPIVGLNDLRDYESQKNGHMAFGSGAFMFGAEKGEAEQPYWIDGRFENICIEASGYSDFYKTDVEYLDEFEHDGRIFLLQYDDYAGPVGDKSPFTDDMAIVDCQNNMMSEFENELLIEHSSDTVLVELKREKYMAYYKTLVKSWMAAHKLKPEKNFPMDEFVKQIDRMKRPDKSYLIDRLFTVLKDKKDLNGVLKKEDLMAFDMFKYIVQSNKESKVSASYRLEHELVGMESVKEQLHRIINMMKMNKLRESKGLSTNNFHNVFLLLGAPGTAKTTVANLLGKLMKEERLLPGDRFASVNGSELKGMYVGHSAPKTKQLFDQNDIILIDEAYSLAAADVGGMDIFAQEALAQLMIELEKHAKDKLVMFAGYGGSDVSSADNKMMEFLKANPGLKSRITSTIVFPSYKADEMVQIVHKQAELMEYVLDNGADNLIKMYFEERQKDKTFGNGREARRLIETCQYFMAERIFETYKGKSTKLQLKTIMPDDIKRAIDKLREDEKAQIGVTGVFGFVPGN
jgi:Holliday junction resolvasome RuvABC ATP-dependent DNA helicase subunit